MSLDVSHGAGKDDTAGRDTTVGIQMAIQLWSILWMELSDQKNVSKLDGDIVALVMSKDYIHYAD